MNGNIDANTNAIANANTNTYNITKNAQNILNKYFNDKDIVCVGEILDHDGYDKYGPESNLWTFYIITKEQNIENNDNIYIIYRYYFEDWFQHHKSMCYNDSLYKLEKRFNLKDIDHYDYDMLNKFKCVFNNDFVLDTLENNTITI